MPTQSGLIINHYVDCATYSWLFVIQHLMQFNQFHKVSPSPLLREFPRPSERDGALAKTLAMLRDAVGYIAYVHAFLSVLVSCFDSTLCSVCVYIACMHSCIPLLASYHTILYMHRSQGTPCSLVVSDSTTPANRAAPSVYARWLPSILHIRGVHVS